MNTKIVSIAVVALVVGIGIGYVIHPASAAQPMGGFTRGNGTFGVGARGTAGMGMGGFLTGTVSAENSTSLTLNTRDGSSHVVLLGSATGVSKTVPGTLADVAVGSNVMIIGTTNSDGSISATMIELRPATSTGPR